MAKEAVLSQDNLASRGFQFCSGCYLCGEHAETIDHLFPHCPWSSQLWKIFINLRGISWVIPRRVVDLLDIWSIEENLSTQKERWKIVPTCIWWKVWNFRNQRCFENKGSSMQKMRMNCLVLYYFWCKHELLEDAEFIFYVFEDRENLSLLHLSFFGSVVNSFVASRLVQFTFTIIYKNVTFL